MKHARAALVHAAMLGVVAAVGGLAGCESGGSVGGGPAPLVQSTGDEEVWSVRCYTVTGPDQQRRAERVAEALRNVRGLSASLVQILADDEGTHVYYGRYRRIYRAGEQSDRYEPDAVKDLELIRSLQLQGSETWPFRLASVELLPTYRSSHPEWDMNALDAYWSLHVAVFYNTETMTGRRQAAEEYCRLLREQGEQAYFHHGTANSSVYVGAFPKPAVAEVRTEDALGGRTSTTNRIVDPQMVELQKRFPTSLHNGHEMYEILRDPSTGEIRERIPTPSFPVRTPRAAAAEDRRLERPRGTP